MERKRNGILNIPPFLQQLEPQMLYLVFNSKFPSLPPGAKTLRTSNSYLVLLFSYSRREVHAQFFVSVCRS